MVTYIKVVTLDSISEVGMSLVGEIRDRPVLRLAGMTGVGEHFVQHPDEERTVLPVDHSFAHGGQ